MTLQYISPVRNAARRIDIYLEELYSDWDVTANEAYTLTHLGRYRPSPVSELHRVVGVRRSTLTAVLDRMESRGWIVRQPSPRDRRAVLVDLTETGQKQARLIRSVVEALEARITGVLGTDELMGFNAVIAAIIAATAKPPG